MSVQENNVTISWTKELEQPDVQQSLTYLIRKLPEIQQSVESLENVITFGQAVLQDKQTIDSIENRINTYPIDVEAIEAGIQLIGKLPMLLQHVQLIEQLTTFVQDVLGDEQSMEQINTSIEQLPFVKEGKDALEIVQEVKKRTELESRESISIFTMMKWLKDPTVQQGLHIVKTTLTVLGERRQN